MQMQEEDLKKSYEDLEKEFDKAMEKIIQEFKDVILTEKLKQTSGSPLVFKKNTSKNDN